MWSKALVVVLGLNAVVLAAPVPNDGSSQNQPSWTKTIQDVAGSPFGNGNGNGNDNKAGNGNKNNGNDNFAGNGNSNGNHNTFGNGNGFLSGNTGLGLGRRNDWDKQSGGQSWSSTIDKVAGSPFGNGNNNGNGNAAGSGNSDNGNGNFGKNGNNNGNDNYFGNSNSFLSGNTGLGLGKKVRRADTIAPGTFYLVPPQLLDSLNQDFSQLFTVVIPETGPAIIKGVLTGKYPGSPARSTSKEKRQVLTGLENIVAQAVSDEAPPNRSGFLGINI